MLFFLIFAHRSGGWGAWDRMYWPKHSDRQQLHGWPLINYISGCQGAAGIRKMKVMKVMSAMPSPQPAGDHSPWRNSGGLTWEPVMWTGIRARLTTMQMRMRMRTKNHPKSMIDKRTMWKTDLEHRDVNGYEGDDGDDADADEKEESSLGNNGSTLNVEDRPGTEWCRWVWGGRWRPSGCGWGARSIASRWWINAEYRGLRAWY